MGLCQQAANASASAMDGLFLTLGFGLLVFLILLLGAVACMAWRQERECRLAHENSDETSTVDTHSVKESIQVRTNPPVSA